MAVAEDHDSAWNHAIAYINAEFGEHVTSLSKAKPIYDEISTTKVSLEQQLSFATTAAPGKIETAVHAAENTTAMIGQFVVDQEVLTGDIANHKVDTVSLVKTLSELTNQMNEIDKYAKYLQVIARIEDFSADVQSALLINSVEKSVAQFFELAGLVDSLQASQCKHLIKYANDTVLFWYNILKDKFAGEFDEALSAWGWPFIVSLKKPAQIQNIAEVKEKLGPLFINLLHLQLPDGLSHLTQTSSPFLLSLPAWRPLLLPIQLMLIPLRKRFRFHFYGNKQTNSLDKPEWYLSQTLTWIRDHREFLRTQIQPLLEQEGLGYVDAVVELTRGLVVLVMEKMLADVPDLLYDDHLFSHLIDEALAFDRELRIVYGYPTGQLGCLHVITQPDPFNKWIMMEKKFAQEKMDTMFSASSAWTSQYKDISDVDDLKVPECGESFMTLMLTISERYKPLPTPQHRLDFLDLQLELLEDFRYRLTQIKIDANQDPLGQCYASILNTASYITEVLREWSELVFFIQLQYFKSVQTSFLSQDQKNTDDESVPPPGDNSENQTSRSKSVSKEMKPSESIMSLDDFDDSKLDSLQGSVFDEIIDLFQRLKNEMVGNIVGYIADDVKARTRPYRKDKWVGMPSIKDIGTPALSTTACEMMLVLRERLQHVEQLLSKPLFTLVWQRVAEMLNSFLYQELILSNKFNDGGSHQLQFDMTRNLFPLFGQYTQKPDSYFKDVKEACQVLTMKSGSAMLLKDVLYRSLHDPKSHPGDLHMDPISALHEQGIYKLCTEEVELLLRLRTDLVTA